MNRLPLFLRWLAVLAWCAVGIVGAEPAIPPLTARVTDLTGTLTQAQAATLEARLKDFEAHRGSQIAVLIVPTTAPEGIEQYGIRAGEQWKLGRKGVDDGALLIVAKNDRALRIEVGYGLEGALNDATAKRIISEDIVPRFQQGDFYGGISAGLERIMAVAAGEPLPPPRPASRRSGNAGIEQYLPVLLIVTLIGGGLLRALLGRFLGATATGGIAAWLAWSMAGALSMALLAGLFVFFFTLLSGFGRVLPWGGGVGGFGGFGGSRGGGNDGFSGGGGGFGGGGASGRW